VQHFSDQGLIALVANGDRSAFAELYDRHGPLAYRLALAMLADPAIARRVVIGVFADVWAGTPLPGSPSAELIALVHVRAARLIRARRGASPLDPRRARVGDTYPDLPAREREVIDRCYLDGMSLRELARRNDLPPSTLAARMQSALAAIAEANRVRKPSPTGAQIPTS
jgi:RNA polymerase sigma-70 factor (ECF subfamily)